MKSAQEIMNFGMTPIFKPFTEPSKTGNKYGLYQVGDTYRLPPNDKVYKCSKCQDHEIIEIGIDSFGLPIYANCDCKAINNVARRLKSSGLNKQQLSYKLSDYIVNKNNLKMFNGVKQYLQTWPELINSEHKSKGFFLLGNVGIGKTMLSCIIANDMLSKGVSVVFASSADLLEELKQAQFTKDEENMESKIQILGKTPVLILDDICKQKMTEWVQSMYYRLIDFRYRNNLLTGINSNYPPEKLKNLFGDYGKPIVSRILEMTGEHFLLAEDYDHRIEEIALKRRR